jgi:hypothetical protein
MANLSSIFKKVVPWLSAVVTGGIPGLVGQAAKEIGQVIGKDVAPTIDSVAQAIAGATPEQIIKLRELDQQFQARMQELGFENVEELERIAAEDRASARQREVAVRDWTPKTLAVVVTAGFFGILSILFFHGVPPEAHDALMLMIGSLGTAWATIVAYYFGSSAGSARKSELLSQNGNSK